MIKNILLALVFCSCSVSASTWTVHNWKDNFLSLSWRTEWTQLSCGGTSTFGSGYIAGATWDFAFDQEYPEWASSGYGSSALQCDGGYAGIRVDGYSDSYTVSIPVGTFDGPVISGGGTDVVSSSCWLTGGYPDWAGGGSFSLLTPGEYWIDFAPDTAIRISTTQPADFGKWAWDGSVNPSWVEPLSASPAKSQHGKKLGHSK
jgi:hypothetical protein